VSHTGCKLGIVGSRIINETAVRALIKAALTTHQPSIVITTEEARGTPRCAREEALDAGYGYITVASKEHAWKAEEVGDDDMSMDKAGQMIMTVPGGTMSRNLRVADISECVIRISAVGTRTYGSGWTADMAERMGKTVERHEV
jgi:hypothetical protein